MTRALVTGATGFVGAHVARALLDEGVEVRALVRTSTDPRNIDGLEIERVAGDLTDHDSLTRAVRGVDVVFHVAARYELSMRDRMRTLEVNIAGTRALMRAALDAGVARVVHTSSTAAIGPHPQDGELADESQWMDAARAAGPYEQSKVLSERVVQAMAERDGLPAVVVNPSAPIGALDRRPTPTGRLIRDAAAGALPGYMRSAGLNIVPVRDVAQGHLLAWRRGRIGERYILGHREGNLTMAEVVRRAAAAAGRRPPRVPIPYPLAIAYAQIDERLLSRVRGRPPQAPIAGVRLARRRLWFSPEKAIRELGLPQSSLHAAFADAVEDLLERPPR